MPRLLHVHGDDGNGHDHGDHDHDHDHGGLPDRAPDAGSRALGEALRSSFAIVRVVLIALVILFIASGFFTVGNQQVAVVLRFGKPVGEGQAALKGPGFHWAFPPPIDEVVKLSVGEAKTVQSTAGWYASTAEQRAARNEPPPEPVLRPERDGYLLTRDANIIHVRATALYRITDPLAYAFNFWHSPADRNYRDGSPFITNALNNALFYAAAQFNVDDAWTREVQRFREAVTERFNALISTEQLGVSVDQLNLEVVPPRQLKAKFDEVVQAGLDRDKLVSAARSYANETLARARGEAESRVNLARSDSRRQVELVGAEAAKFAELQPQYGQNPSLFVERRLAEVMGRVMTNVQEKFFVPARADGQSRELRLLLGREPIKPKLPERPRPPADDH